MTNQQISLLLFIIWTFPSIAVYVKEAGHDTEAYHPHHRVPIIHHDYPYYQSYYGHQSTRPTYHSPVVHSEHPHYHENPPYTNKQPVHKKPNYEEPQHYDHTEHYYKDSPVTDKPVENKQPDESTTSNDDVKTQLKSPLHHVQNARIPQHGPYLRPHDVTRYPILHHQAHGKASSSSMSMPPDFDHRFRFHGFNNYPYFIY